MHAATWTAASPTSFFALIYALFSSSKSALGSLPCIVAT